MTHQGATDGPGTPPASVFKRYLYRMAYARELLLLAGLLVVVVAGLLSVTYLGVGVLSSVRAYTNAEALYSKAQKDAVYYLHQYAISGQEEYFEKYERAIAVPLGYRQARVELEKADPDPAVIRQGLVQGRSDPADAAAPIWLFQWLRRAGPTARALRLWSEADLLVAQLQNVAALLHDEVASGAADPSHVAALLREVERINVNLTTLEETFSATLGEAAGRVRRVVLAAVLVAALLLLGLGLVPAGRMLKRLKNSEEKFRRLFEQSRDAIVVATPQGRVAYANPAAYALFGHPPEAYGQQRLADLAMAACFSRDAEHESWQRALEHDGFVRDFECQVRRLDGAVLDALVTSTRIQDRSGRVVGFESILRDVSDRKRTERRMRLLERAVEASGNVILITDATRPDFPVVYVNPAFERITGFAADEALGRNGFFLLAADQEEAHRPVEVLQRALLDEAESRLLLRNHRKDGSVFWNELSFAPVYDAQGVLINYVGIQTDVTEIKEAEQMLQKALAKEKELSEIQSRFVSMASHEFRTPLATILSSAELVERFRHQWDEDRTLKHLQRIQAGVRALTDLLENVLIVGRGEAGRLPFRAEAVDLGAFCREVIDDVWLGAGADHEIEVKIPPQPFSAQADPNLLRYLLSNLLTNAAKYSPAGSRVRFHLIREDEQVVFRVADEGIGIPADDLDHVVEPFHRARNAQTIPGTGLGLSIVRRVAALHGGVLTIESEEGCGTVVTVALPLTAPTNAAVTA